MAGEEGIKSKVVRIKGLKPRPYHPNKFEVVIFAGTVIVSEPHFCFVIVSRDMIQDGFTYEVCFPDGVKAPVQAFSLPPDVPTRSQRGNLAAFYVERSRVAYDANRITAAHLGEKASNFQVVHLCDFDKNLDMFVSPGRVNSTGQGGNDSFMHDCASSIFTQNGAPVFNDDDELVGICYSDACYAHDVDQITKDLLKLDEARGPGSPKTFWEFVETVKASGP